MKNKKVEKARNKMSYDFTMGFVASLIVLFGTFLGDLAKDIFNFRYYYFIPLVVVVVLYFLVRRDIGKLK